MRKSIVVFFSTGGVTKRIAEYTELPRVELLAKEPYSDEDLLTANPRARVCVEQEKPQIRTELADNNLIFNLVKEGKIPNWNEITDIYIGGPIWFMKFPRIILTFIEKSRSELSNKRIHVFATSGGSPINKAIEELRNNYAEINWGKTKQFSYTSTPQEVKDWVAL